jgi:hypothetical protein
MKFYNCPKCGETLGHDNNITGKGIPVEGNVLYCLACKSILIFRNDDSIEVMHKKALDNWKLTDELSYNIVEWGIKKLEDKYCENQSGDYGNCSIESGEKQ